MHAEPYSLEQDGDFLFEVYVCTRADEVRSWGFGEAEAAQFLRSQHRMQLASYDAQFPHAERRILWKEGVRAGYVFVDREPHELRLVEIALLPQFRGRGLGTDIIRGLQMEAAQRGIPVGLTVRMDNRARDLYVRLGFDVVSTHEPYLQMVWSPKQKAANDQDQPSTHQGDDRVRSIRR